MLSTSIGVHQVLQTAIQYHQAGNLPQAEGLYRQILASDPRQPDALHLLGVLARQAGHPDASIDLIQQAIRVRPDYPEALSNVSVTLTERGRLDEAIAYCQRAILLRPNFPDAHGNLGNALRAAGRTDEALASFRKAIALAPDNAAAYSNLGGLLQELRQTDEAIVCLRRAVALQPNFPDAYNNLGNALRDLMQTDEAIACCRKAIALRPNYPEAYNNLGGALRENLQVSDAVAACQKAIDQNPTFAGAHNNLSNVLLLKGDFLPGWAHYEWRWKLPEFERLRAGEHLLWKGASLPGQTILLSTEQGFGDAIQFVRYAPLVKERCGRVVLDCREELVSLMRGAEGIDEVVKEGDIRPPFAAYCPLLSLPGVFGTTLSTIPARVPYITPDAERAASWANRLAGERRLKIGLSWAGRPTHKGDRHRSIPLALLAPLAAVRGTVFYSLQKGPAAEQAKSPPPGMELIDLSADLHDFAETAAVLANLDLLISVDTAIVHLAGSLARPVWTLLPYSPDWRWLLDRSDSPWYPTMRLFRQPAVGNWTHVVDRVAQELDRHVEEFSNRPTSFETRIHTP